MTTTKTNKILDFLFNLHKSAGFHLNKKTTQYTQILLFRFLLPHCTFKFLLKFKHR